MRNGWKVGVVAFLLVMVGQTFALDPPAVVEAQQTDASQFMPLIASDSYSIEPIQTADWFAIKIAHSVVYTGYPFVVNGSIVEYNLSRTVLGGTEYVALDKVRKGEIGFTSNGTYAA